MIASGTSAGMSKDTENRPSISTSSASQPRRAESSSPLLVAFPTSANQPDPPSSSHAEEQGADELKSNGTASGQSSLAIPGRKASVYPNNLAQKQMRKFARSAEKRQSIHMLGSIEHLQHHFSKVGLAAKTAPDVRGALRPAVGPVSTAHLAVEPDNVLPPSPLPPVTVERAPYPTTAAKIDLSELRSEAVENLKAVEVMWRTQGVEEDGEVAVSVLDLLIATIKSIRSIRNYSLALPASALGGQHHLHPGLRRTSGSAPAVRSRQSISTPSRPTPTPSHIQPKAIDVPDPLAPLRKSAIDTLTALRGIEERSRLEGSNVASDETGTSGELSRSATPALSETHSNPSGSGYGNVEELEEEDPWEAFFFAERGGRGAADARRPWEERITSGEEGWLYRSDLFVERDLQTEKIVLGHYFDAVETIIFPNECSRRRHGQRAWHVKASLMPTRRSSAGARLEEPASAEVVARGHSRSPSPMPEVQEQEEVSAEPSTISLEDLPLWARPGWPGTPLERLHEFLLAHLPLDLCLLLPSPTHGDFANRFLARLADGYLLIVAFNATVEKSRASWGHIHAEDVHDTVGLEQDSARTGAPPKDWTFRRVANLKCLGAALKLRYAIPLAMPSEPAQAKSIVPLQPSSETAAPDKPRDTRSRPPSWVAIPGSKASGGKDKAEPIPFDPVAIARRDPGWETTLEKVVETWVEAVARESQQEDA